jgi:hypothetical protein
MSKKKLRRGSNALDKEIEFYKGVSEELNGLALVIKDPDTKRHMISESEKYYNQYLGMIRAKTILSKELV